MQLALGCVQSNVDQLLVHEYYSVFLLADNLCSTELSMWPMLSDFHFDSFSSLIDAF